MHSVARPFQAGASRPTFNGDHLHALHAVQRSQARVGRPVEHLAVLPVGQHDRTGAASSLAAAQLGAVQALLCGGSTAGATPKRIKWAVGPAPRELVMLRPRGQVPVGRCANCWPRQRRRIAPEGRRTGHKTINSRATYTSSIGQNPKLPRTHLAGTAAGSPRHGLVGARTASH